LRPLSVLNDVDEFHHMGEGDLGAHDGRIVEVASHGGELGVALEQRERRMDVGPELLLNLHLESLEGCNKTMELEGNPMMVNEEHIKEGAVTLIGMFQGNEHACHLRCPGYNVAELIEGRSDVHPPLEGDHTPQHDRGLGLWPQGIR
jgi:hypothetical protein